MKLLLALLFAFVFTIAAPEPNFIQQVTDEVLPALDRAVNDAAMGSVDIINGIILRDTDAWIKKALQGIPFLPGKNKCADLMMKHIVAKIGQIITSAVKRELPSKVMPVMALVKSELYRVDSGLDELLRDFHRGFLEKLKLQIPQKEIL